MSFYNPYKKTPDYGQGIQDLIQQLLPILMMNKYMGKGKAGATATAPTSPQEPLENVMKQDPSTGMSLQGPGMVPPTASQSAPAGAVSSAVP
jgi:hypothetical protein